MLIAKSSEFYGLQLLDLGHGVLESLLEVILFGKFQAVAIVGLDQPAGKDQKLHAKRLQSLVAISPGQAKPLEVMDNIEGQKQELEESYIGDPILGRNLGQGVIVSQLADMFFDSGSGRVKSINPPSSHVEIGDKDMIGVLDVLEQGQLLGLRRVLWDGPAHHHIAMSPLPPVRSVPELTYLPAILEPSEPATPGFDSDGIALSGFGDDHISIASTVEEFDHALPIEPGIQPEADARLGDVFGHLGQADLDERDCSGRSPSIARTQRPMPEFLEPGLESQKRMVRTPSVFLGVVADARSLHPPPVDYQHGGIQIEDQAGSLVGSVEKPLAQQVVDSYDLSDLLGSQPFEKPSDCRLIWKAAESDNLLEGPIVLQDLSFVDSLHPGDDGIQQRHKHLGRMVVSVSRAWAQGLLQQPLETESVAKCVNQRHPREVREVRFLEGDRQISKPFGHCTQSYLLSRVLCKTNTGNARSVLPSRNPSSHPSTREQITHH